jgi:hypothetical protein
MYFEDLSPYCYCMSPDYCTAPCLNNVLNIGWLDTSHVFSVGDVSPIWLARLKALVAQAYPNVNVEVNRMRCIHPCNLCGNATVCLEDRSGTSHCLGMSEIWIPGMDKWYAAPSMVVHYIEAHRYLPPEDFVSTVERMSVTTPYNAQDIYLRLMEPVMRRGVWG